MTVIAVLAILFGAIVVRFGVRFPDENPDYSRRKGPFNTWAGITVIVLGCSLLLV